MNLYKVNFFSKIVLFSVLSLTILFSSCNKDDDSTSKKSKNANDFIWRAMNSWYLWQEDIPNLADSKLNQDYDSYISSYSNPEQFFNSLLYSGDRFSRIVENYDELDKTTFSTKGDEYESFGINFKLILVSETEIVGFIRYVVQGSSAEQQGFKRGMFFHKINGKQITTTNYHSLLYETGNSLKFSILDNENEQLYDNGKTITITKSLISEDPIFLEKVIEVGGSKIGYLVFNSFSRYYHQEMNDVFGRFKAENITDLILDLRYNSGGDIVTAESLASMILGQNQGDVFTQYAFNQKHSRYNYASYFSSSIPVYDANDEVISEPKVNALTTLNSIYILTSDDTASASELIINGLRPYINVILIGDKTIGKNVGSVALKDIPDNDFIYDKSIDYLLNKSHKYALRLIALKSKNSQGFGEYSDGFNPNYTVSEYDYLLNLNPLGDYTSEPLLAKAIDLMTGSNYYQAIPKTNARTRETYKSIYSSSSDGFYGNDMIIHNLKQK
ncbi:MAG: peptidase S41 [Flavobacteriales bacterium]|nr:peptidase S41 [Flavobacteriales bacterium]